MDETQWKDWFVELIRRSSCDLPPDVERALEAARDAEEGRARSTLEWILKNAAAARAGSVPICQDTGTLVFHVEHGPDLRPGALERALCEAAREATRRSYLRPNAVDPVSGRNSGDNTGRGSPFIHFQEVEQPGRLRVRLMQKGGGCENVGIQYSLPDDRLAAGRDWPGIKKCILDAALQAQGYGCAPGVLGVGVGGDRGSSYLESKEQFLRAVDDVNPDPTLAAVEAELLARVNELGIGPMGFGGRTTVFGVKIGLRHRLPASFFVSVSYMCWAYRRRELTVRDGQAVFA